MAYANTLREEELKNKVATDYFNAYDSTKIIGNIDFCIAKITDKSGGRQATLFDDVSITQSFLWAEAKRGNNKDIYESFVQLIMTIGKARTYEKQLPPIYLGAFDAEKIAFVPYITVSSIFTKNDFDWTVTASDHETKEFKEVYSLVKDEIEQKSYLFYYDKNDQELRQFIKLNFVLGRSGTEQISVTKNNFTTVYYKWLYEVKPTISIDWEKAKQLGILDADFYLADLLSRDNESIKDSLFVLLKRNQYFMYRKDEDELGLKDPTLVEFKDNQRAHRQFWSRYARPPRKEFWNYIVERRDLLVPQDVRERKGSFFTPQKWVELSQKYLADVLGENWQDEYYIWDCCAGTGNLLNGLTNKYNIWASTLDKADVDVMKDRIKNGANLLASHVFQMDFLNDRFEEKCPKGLLDIISNPEKRKKLVIYINPPYAEAASTKTLISSSTNCNKTDVSKNNNTYNTYIEILRKSGRELFIQFFTRIYKEIPNCFLAEFSKLKILQSPNFNDFRNLFLAKLEKSFIVPSFTFDNVKGKFPIGFFIWNTEIKTPISSSYLDIYDCNSMYFGIKHVFVDSASSTINDWLKQYTFSTDSEISAMCCVGTDFQHQNYVNINFKKLIKGVGNAKGIAKFSIQYNNLEFVSIYFSVRLCIEATWLNDRDQFLYPNDGWMNDKEFQADCLVYTLFHGQNRISADDGINHWIPFTEKEVDAKDEFQSHFMTDYIKEHHLNFSNEAQAVFDAGRELWRYYHQQPNAQVNASFYDIRSYFQGRDEKGKMKKDSKDTRYNELISGLRQAMKSLAKKIEPKVYEYGFLRK